MINEIKLKNIKEKIEKYKYIAGHKGTLDENFIKEMHKLLTEIKINEFKKIITSDNLDKREHILILINELQIYLNEIIPEKKFNVYSL